MQLPPIEGLLRGEWVSSIAGMTLGAELPGFGPGAEIPLRRRFRVGGIEHVALAFRATQQVAASERQRSP
jgi:hypothetical protein